MSPFLKWPGGKRWLIKRFRHIFPLEYNNYFEPFLGGGAAFFYLKPKNAMLSDINVDLMNTYRVMARNPVELRERLEEHQKQHSAEYYYHTRITIPSDQAGRAARFIYLNRTCFNGIHRVNKLGEFNVPIGTRKQFVDDIYRFEEYSQILQNINIRTHDFVNTIRKANEGDLIFADPPYTIANNQNLFIKYNENLFSWKDQKRLLKALVKARERGAIIIATNANYSKIRSIYEENNFQAQSISRFSSISGINRGRGNQEELLITSFKINL